MIKIFTPPKFKKQPLNIEKLNFLTNKNWIYSSSGRSSIYHILKDKHIDKILIPIYICDTVLEPLKKLNIKPIFYDLDIVDLNPSLDSIKKLAIKYEVKGVLVSSMYGNPANLLEIEKYCEENNIFMIDDSAQSFGAKLNERFVGTFGDAGFFSFSPGKPTAGYMGSFFWDYSKVDISRTKHCITHYIRWLDFFYNRYNIYEYNKNRFLNIINRILLKTVNTTYDEICEFEKDILGGILWNNIENKFSFRKEYYLKFIEKFDNYPYFRILKSIRGEPNPHKFVIIFNSQILVKKFLNYMEQNNIYVSNGYELLNDDLKYLPNAKEINKKVVELPIEDNSDRMDYLFRKIEEFYD